MKIFDYDYTVFPDNSPERFQDSCKKIENHFLGIQKQELLVDVDGSTIQVYTMRGKKIIVFDDYDIGAVFVKSDMDLSVIFPK